MGNEVLSKRSSQFYKGFNKDQLQYLKQKFDLLQTKGFLNENKVGSQYKCEKVAKKVFKLFDLSADEDNQGEGQVDEYQFICNVAGLCNSPISRISSIVFNIISDDGNKINEKQLLTFTQIVLKYNSFKKNEKALKDSDQIKKINKTKFKNADFDKNKSIDVKQFSDFCLSDLDYKEWMHYMGFISKKQLENKDQLIDDDYDSDLEQQYDRYTGQVNAEVDKIRMGIEHKVAQQKLTKIKKDDQDVGEEAVGDFMWKNQIRNIKWETKTNIYSPSQNLTMEHAFGYRGFDSRNNLHYNSNGKIIYPTAALGIVYDQKSKKQQFLVAHNNDITCLDVVDDLAASGQMGSKPTILVWKTQKSKENKEDKQGQLEVIHYINSGLKQSVGNIAISPSKKYLAASCNNEDHDIIIYDLQLLQKAKKQITSQETGIVVSDKASRQIILSMIFSADQKTLIVSTSNHVLLYTFTNSQLKSNRCMFGKYQNSSALCLCLLKNKEEFASGMTNGSIYIWKGQQLIQSLIEHDSPVYSIKSIKNSEISLVSGDKNGQIILWTQKYGILNKIDIPSITDIRTIVSLSTYKECILVGTRGCEIFEINLNKKKQQFCKTILQSHSQKQLKALCVGQKDFVYTGGQDKILFKWSIKQKKAEVRSKRKYPIQSIDHNKNLGILAIGYKNGVVEFLTQNSLVESQSKTTIVEFKNPDREVLSLVKFDRQGKLLAICYTYPQYVVMLYDISNNRKLGKMRVESKVISLDFATDFKEPKDQKDSKKSKYTKIIQLNTESQQYFAFDISQVILKGKGNEVFDIPQLKGRDQLGPITDVIWNTHSLTMSKPTSGIFTKGITQADITCCQLNPDLKNRNCLIVGDKYSHLKLFIYPCLKYEEVQQQRPGEQQQQQHLFNKYKGHGGQITGLRFTYDQKYFLSIGGEDKTLIIWKYDGEQIKNQQEQYLSESKVKALEGEQQKQVEQQLKRLQQQSEKSKIKESEFNQYEMVEEDSGQQAMATKAFLGQLFQPSSFNKNQKRDNKKPKQSLKLTHSFGIRTFYLADEIRNQARFNQTGDTIVYPTAALGVQLETKSLEQTFYSGHQQDIVCFAIDKSRSVAATGQMAQINTTNPLAKIVSIHVWDVKTKKSLKVLNGFHTIAVVLVQFSPDSTLLFSCGNDNQNSFAVYNWKSGAIIYSGPVSKGKVNGISWKNNSEFATCGNDHIKFWTKNKSTQGKITGKSQQMFSIINSGQIYVTGSLSGGLFNWVGGSASKIAAHTNKVQTLAVSNQQLFSGGQDGIIMIWPLGKDGGIKTSSKKLDMRLIIPNDYKLRQKQFSVLSIDFHPNSKTNTMLIVTGGCEIFTMTKEGKKCQKLLSGHYKNELWGLATSPDNNDIFVTTGDDGTIRQWSIKNKKMLYRQTLQDQTQSIRAIDWSKQGNCIVAADNLAQLHVYSADLQKIITQGFKTQIYSKKGKKKYFPWVEELKISPNGKLIAFGGHTCGAYLQIVKMAGGKLQHSLLEQQTSAVLHIDWDLSSQLISMNTQSYQLMFYNITQQTKGKLSILKASSFRDTEWATWTKKLGWPVMGIFQGVDYSDVKSVCVDHQKQMIAVGYTDQTIRLFKYPAYVPKQVCHQYNGHSSFVTRVRFNRQYLISVGGNDKTILIWKVEGLKNIFDQKDEKVGKQQEQEQLLECIDVPKGAVKQKTQQTVDQDQFVEEQQNGDEFMAIKPWVGAIREPTYQYPTATQKAPENVSIQLEHVYGYRCKDSRQNIYYHKQNKILYHAAAVVIYHDKFQNSQQFNTEHQDDILSIDYHKEKNLVLTGELGPKPLIMLSDGSTSIRQWRNAVTKGVMCLAISPSGKKAVCVGMDDNHKVAVIDLQKSNKVLASKDGGKQIILKSGWINQQQFVTVGIKHYKYWTLQDNSQLIDKKGSGKLKSYVSLAISDNLILTGSQGNTLTSWKGSSSNEPIVLPPKTKTQQQQTTTITSVIQCIVIKNKYVLAGTKDKKIFVLSKSLSMISFLNIQQLIDKSCCASIRAIDVSQDQKSIIIGTLGAQIYQLTFNKKLDSQNNNQPQVKQIIKGHYSPNNKWTNQVWGLCVDQNQNSKMFYTTSDDATVRGWDWEKRKMVMIQSLNFGPMKDGRAEVLQKDKKLNDYVDGAKGRVVAVSPDGQQIFVGCKNGVVRIFEIKNKKIKYKNLFRKAKREISQIKFHNQICVIGSHDAHIYVYSYQDGNLKQKYKALKKHSSYITHLDISRDCSYMQSTCGAYEILFWDIQTGKQLTGGATMLRDQLWATWSCTLGWPVQGIWPKFTNGTFIHSTDRSHKSILGQTFKQKEKQDPYLLALGNNNGKVVIHNYPCKLKGSEGIVGKGHSSHITNVKWTPDDSRIISAGGEDQCIMQWKVTKSGSKSKKTKAKK